MRLRNREYGEVVVQTAFNTAAAIRAAQEAQDAHHLDDDAGDPSDTEEITAGIRSLDIPASTVVGRKRRLSQLTSPWPSTMSAPTPLSATESPSATTHTIFPASREPSATATAQPTQMAMPLDGSLFDRPPGATAHLPTSPPPSANVTPAPGASACTPAVTKQDRRNHARKLRRQDKRAAEGADRRPSLARTMELVMQCCEEETTCDVHALPTTKCAYNARRNELDGQPESIEKLVKEGYKVVLWNGRDPKVISGEEGHSIAILAGRPKGSSFDAACTRIYNLMNMKGAKLQVSPKYMEHCRGAFPAINVGVTHGKGSKMPHTLDHGARVSKIVYEIIRNKDMQRVAGFQDAAFRVWSPKLHHHYKTNMEKMWRNKTLNKKVRLVRNFKGSVFPCIALNFGPHVWTREHRDTKNLPYGLCAITALGEFDPMMGGHLVLPELKLIIEFPPGSTILIPSATLTHCNIPVCEGESRVSFTQFAAGDIFRFIDCGFKTETQLAHDNPEKYAEHLEWKKGRWKQGLAMLSKVDELLIDNIVDIENLYED